MIFSLIKKYFKPILDGLIVAALIVAFSLWDPFNFFSSDPKLRDTPVSLRSIRDIGELITAEYYGEVIESLKESMIYNFDKEELNVDAADLYNDLISSVILLKEQDDTIRKKLFSLKNRVKKRNIDRKFGRNFPEVVSHYLYKSLIDNIADYNDISINTDTESAVLWHLFKRERNDLEGYLETNDEINEVLKEIESYYLVQRTDSLNQEKIKKQIIYVGRGWVKAGINFRNFNDKNFWYNKDRQIIYFRDFDPQILNYDINPWFIPEKKIKGFELIVATGKIKHPLEESTKVKIRCKEKLRTQAIEAGILEQAKQNARESLKHLFSVLLDTEIKDVIFTRNKYKYLYKEVSRDSVIDTDEAEMLALMINRDCRILDTAWYDDYKIQLSNLTVFIEDLKKLKTIPGYSLYNRTTALTAGMFDDSVFSYNEFLALDSLFKHLKNCSTDEFPFYVKKQLFQYYCEPNPDFNEIYDYLKDDTLKQLKYLNIDSNKMFAENRIQYVLSKKKKNEFIRLFLDSLNSRLPTDLCYEDIYWFDSLQEYEAVVYKLAEYKINYTDSVDFKNNNYLLIEDKVFFDILSDSNFRLVKESLIKIDTARKIIPVL
ncbi:MAG: DUF4230 domain-containing protein [Bacteroidetes bacterium]|nr:DUF4230 domain-containing protein [Bacteroidota bacterium]MBL7103728.1 DUF4230 domain-containing protein [Bacteroidales bacterium]